MPAIETIRYPSNRIPEPDIAKVLFANTRLAPVWSLVRLYVGYEWLRAGYEKLVSPMWIGAKPGTALTNSINGALKKTGGEPRDITGWYARFLGDVVLPHAVVFSYLVTFGEILIGIGLILGIFTGIMASFGGFMAAQPLLAGSVATNPILFVFAICLALAWRVAGYYGLDRYMLPILGVSGVRNNLLQRREKPTTTAPPSFMRSDSDVP